MSLIPSARSATRPTTPPSWVPDELPALNGVTEGSPTPRLCACRHVSAKQPRNSFDARGRPDWLFSGVRCRDGGIFGNVETPACSQCGGQSHDGVGGRQLRKFDPFRQGSGPSDWAPIGQSNVSYPTERQECANSSRSMRCGKKWVTIRTLPGRLGNHCYGVLDPRPRRLAGLIDLWVCMGEGESDFVAGIGFASVLIRVYVQSDPCGQVVQYGSRLQFALRRLLPVRGGSGSVAPIVLPSSICARAVLLLRGRPRPR